MNPPRANELVFEVSDFVAYLNQTLEVVYPSVLIVGELSNFRVSKGRWAYFDLKDDQASVKFFGTVYNLPGPLEDGMVLQVRGQPRLHPLYGFSITIQSIQPIGEGSIRKAADLLKMKLEAEGLFDISRKRSLPFPPSKIGLIASSQSAGYADFMKIIDARWCGVEIDLRDVQVQGEAAIDQIVEAITMFNQRPSPPEVLVITRGGGSVEDLAVFNVEKVVRAVASSRIPTLVAIGHEVDVSLAELAADVRASTPSNAAELLVPDKASEQLRVRGFATQIDVLVQSLVNGQQIDIDHKMAEMRSVLHNIFVQAERKLSAYGDLLEALNPKAVLSRGYAIVRQGGKVVSSGIGLKVAELISVDMFDARLSAIIEDVELS